MEPQNSPEKHTWKVAKKTKQPVTLKVMRDCYIQLAQVYKFTGRRKSKRGNGLKPTMFLYGKRTQVVAKAKVPLSMIILKERSKVNEFSNSNFLPLIPYKLLLLEVFSIGKYAPNKQYKLLYYRYLIAKSQSLIEF